MKAAPGWAQLGVFVTFAYALLRFGIFSSQYEGSPKATQTGFVLTDHGQTLRTLSAAEYWDAARAQVAFMFGFLMAFGYWAAVFYTYASKSNLPAESRGSS
jgi:hypothetical protein